MRALRWLAPVAVLAGLFYGASQLAPKAVEAAALHIPAVYLGGLASGGGGLLGGGNCSSSSASCAVAAFTSTTLAATTGAFSDTVTITKASGSNALALATSGSRIDFGAGASDYASSDGTYVIFAGPIKTGNQIRLVATTTEPLITNGSNLSLASVDALGLRGGAANGATATGVAVTNFPSLTTAGAEMLSLYPDNAATKKAAIDKDGTYIFYGNPTLRTCAAAIEGAVSRDVASGVSTGKRTKLCLCTSDGAGSPAYVWQNLATGTLGSTTTCGSE